MSISCVRVERLKSGDTVTVRNAMPYELPKGLAQGATVTVIDFRNCGYQVRDEAGKEWHLPRPCVNAPQSYLWENKRWLPAEHELVVAALEAIRGRPDSSA